MPTTLNTALQSVSPYLTMLLEIENPGLLPFGLTIEDIQKGISKLRNRVIGRVF